MENGGLWLPFSIEGFCFWCVVDARNGVAWLPISDKSVDRGLSAATTGCYLVNALRTASHMASQIGPSVPDALRNTRYVG